MATTINSNTTDGVVITPDTSGEIELQANGVTKAKITANGLQDNNGNSLRGGSYRNLIINGDMRIDQRGSASTPITNNYCVDRFKVEENSDGAFTGEQSTDAPSVEPFINSLKCTVTTTDTNLGTTQYARVSQTIEGLNIPHLMWGTSEAKTITVSFWVKASVTGAYDFSLQNDAGNRTYMTSYTINSADTWEKKTITIAGDTTGIWKTDNDRGIRVYWGLGTGTSYQTSTTGWQGANVLGSDTPNTNFLATSGATWYLTGVQLEVGEGASDFEHLPYDVQLQMCQRYYQCNFKGTWGQCFSSTNAIVTLPHAVQMRTVPAVGQKSGVVIQYDIVGGLQTVSSFSPTNSGPNASALNVAGFSGRTVWQAVGLYDEGTELIAEL